MPKIIDKPCERCGKTMSQVPSYQKYCAECRPIVTREIHQRCAANKPKKVARPEEEYPANFNAVVKEPIHLTTRGFDEVSPLNSVTYMRHYKLSWTTIVKNYGKFYELFDFVLTRYNAFMDATGQQAMKAFCDYDKYITQDVALGVDFDKIREKLGITKLRYEDQDFYTNFNNIIQEVGHIPLYQEFAKHTKISLQAYTAKFNLSGKVYEGLVKSMVSETEYKLYKDMQQKHKADVGRVTGPMSAKHTEEDYDNEFKRVFDTYKEQYGDYPCQRTFNKVSKIHGRSYRKKFDLSWLDLCKKYGYPTTRTANRAEKMVLECIKKITGCDYDAQKTYPWLISEKGGHMFYDGVFEDGKFVVEFDGEQHREPVDAFGGQEAFERCQRNDELKNKLAREHGYTMIRISSEYDWFDPKQIAILLDFAGVIPPGSSKKYY